ANRLFLLHPAMLLNYLHSYCYTRFIVTDKVLVNNGQAVAEYEIVSERATNSITKEKNLQDLQNLPQSNAAEYVMNWFSTHVEAPANSVSGPPFTKLPRSTGSSTTEDSLGSFESSVDESENEHLKRTKLQNITFRKTYRKKRKVAKDKSASKRVDVVSKASNVDPPLPDISQLCTSFENAEEFTKEENFSKESGIRTPDTKATSIEAQTPNDGGLVKVQDASSDYLTCSSNSLFEKNVFETTEDVSVDIFTADESKSVRSLQSYIAKSEGVCSSDLSFVSVSEVYKYVDNDEGIVLYEKRLLKTSSEYNGSVKSSSFSSKLSSLPDTVDYDIESLRKELTSHGYNPGPITVTTKRVYLKKTSPVKETSNLGQRNQDPLRIEEKRSKKFSSQLAYSVELEKTLRDANWHADLTVYKSLEAMVVKQFGTPDPARKWREGVSKSSFTYLLLDPRVTNNLPCRAELLQPKEIWETFLSAVFYIGKGKRARPYSHLYEAVTLWRQGNFTADSKKIQHIIDIWNSNGGVICLHVFQNIIPVEAYTRGGRHDIRPEGRESHQHQAGRLLRDSGHLAAEAEETVWGVPVVQGDDDLPERGREAAMPFRYKLTIFIEFKLIVCTYVYRILYFGVTACTCNVMGWQI
ncbi:hypothetical protein NQ318_001047, partial [Aromia moschata]